MSYTGKRDKLSITIYKRVGFNATATCKADYTGPWWGIWCLDIEAHVATFKTLQIGGWTGRRRPSVRVVIAMRLVVKDCG